MTDEQQLPGIILQSFVKTQAIFKHSTRCSISSMVKSRLEKASPSGDVDFYYLDLIAHRALSNKVAETFNVYHESPQILLIRNGECIYDESHLGISMDDIMQHAA